MSLWQRARLFLKFQWHKRRHNYAPLVSLLFLTSRCNLASCAYCFAEYEGEFPDLPVDQWKHIIDELKRRGCDLVFLMGGEPLLYSAFEELIDYVKGHGMQCHLTTNGLLIPQYIDALKKVDLLMVSLDGASPETNDLNRGHGSFRKIVRGIEAAKEHGIPLRINCVLTQHNVRDIENLLEYGRTINAYVGFTIPARGKHPERVNDMLLTDVQIRQTHLRLLRLQQKGQKITLSEKSLIHVAYYPKAFHELIRKGDPLCHKYRECMYGRYIVFVDAEGSVYPCTTLWELPDTYQPMNLFRDGVDVTLQHAQHPPCHICWCAGGVEWSRITSWRGLGHAIRFSMTQ